MVITVKKLIIHNINLLDKYTKIMLLWAFSLLKKKTSTKEWCLLILDL